MAEESYSLYEGGFGVTTTMPLRRGAERRLHERRLIDVPLIILSADHDEFTGNVVDISFGGVKVKTDFIPELQDKVVLYIDHIGRFECLVHRLEPRHVAFQMAISEAKAERLDGSLKKFFDTYAKDAPISDRRLNQSDLRVEPRFIAKEEKGLIGHSDADLPFECRVRNISLTGIEIETQAQLNVGANITVGAFSGIIIRETDVGYALEKTDYT